MAKPAEKQVARRNDVVQAALRVIARNGLENSSFRAIAAELSCTVGVLTHYFPNREALMHLVLETVSAPERVLAAVSKDDALVKSMDDVSESEIAPSKVVSEAPAIMPPNKPAPQPGPDTSVVKPALI